MSGAVAPPKRSVSTAPKIALLPPRSRQPSPGRGITPQKRWALRASILFASLPPPNSDEHSASTARYIAERDTSVSRVFPPMGGRGISDFHARPPWITAVVCLPPRRPARWAPFVRPPHQRSSEVITVEILQPGVQSARGGACRRHRRRLGPRKPCGCLGRYVDEYPRAGPAGCHLGGRDAWHIDDRDDRLRRLRHHLRDDDASVLRHRHEPGCLQCLADGQRRLRLRRTAYLGCRT